MMRKLFLPLALILSSFFISCSNESTQVADNSKMYDKSYIESASIKEKLEYEKFYLLKLANWVNKKIQEAEFRNEVNSLSKKADKDDNIYIKDLFNFDRKNNVDKKNNEEIEKSLNAFTNLEGENWFPALTIVNNKIGSSTNKVLDVTKPIFLFVEEESNDVKENFIGYQADSEDDDLEAVDEPINEINAQGKMMYIMDVITENENSGGGGGTGNVNYGLSRIEKMTIKDHKEDWISGASEIHISTYYYRADPDNSGFCGWKLSSSVDCGYEYGREISTYKRKEVRNEDEKTLNFLFHNNPISSVNPTTIPLAVYYTIFEKDNWPAPTRNENIYFPNGEHAVIPFRSWQSSYHGTMVMGNSSYPSIPALNGYSYENGGIRYNLINN
jgi:hypothetical protein